MAGTLEVRLSDALVRVDGWTPDLDVIGDYKLRIRKTPDEIRREAAARAASMYAPSRPNPIRTEERSVLSHDKKHPGRVYFLPGLWPRVQSELKARGIGWTVVEDQRDPGIRPELDWSAFEGVEFREKQDVAIAMIAEADCGVIECCTAWGKSFVISLLCKALPTLNIVIATASTQVVGTLYEYLCKTIPGQVGVLGGGRNRTEGKRVIVTTLKSLPNIPPDNVHLVLVDECHAVGDNVAGQELMKFCFARRFGFSASPIRNDGSALMMESILGPTILKVGYEEAVESHMVTPMKYLMLDCPNCPDAAKRSYTQEVTLKRWSYWCNNARNRVIRDFVYRLKSVYDGQILIMVSTLEHALNLHRLLPWFKVAYYGSADFGEIKRKYSSGKYAGIDINQYKMSPKQLDIMRNAFAKGTLRYVISTKTWKQGKHYASCRSDAA